MATKTSPVELQSYLKDAEYPCSRDDLVIIAEANDANDRILDILESLPDVQYESVTDVQEAFGASNGKEDSENQHKSSQRSESSQSASASGTQRRSRKREIEERKRHLKEETGKLTEPGKTVTGEPDHRLKGQETEAIKAARHMEHGKDDRGQVKNPEMDARLKENRDTGTEERQAKSEPPKQTWRQYSKK